MSYYLRDASDYLGDLASTIGLYELRKYAVKAKAENLLGFLDKGAALVTDVLIKELKSLQPTDKNVQEILGNLIVLVEKADLCLIITDGVND